METTPGSGLTILDEDQCWDLLRIADVGRLAVVVAGEPEIFPVTFIVDGRSLVFRTAEGTKLYGITASPQVALEADGFAPDRDEAWSVVAKGRAERLDRFTDIYAAEGLPLHPWPGGGTRQWFVRIEAVTVTGIRFPVERDDRSD